MNRITWLACLWLCGCGGPTSLALAASAPVEPLPGGTLHSAALKLLSLAAPELRHPSVAPVGERLEAHHEAVVDLLSVDSTVGHTVLPLSSYKYTASRTAFAAFVLLYLFYTAMCVWYELHCLRIAERATEAASEAAKRASQVGGCEGTSAASEAPAVPKQRFVEWDLIKAVMLFFVILLHTGRNAWKKGGLSDSEQTFFLMLASFPMPTFTFISGVFGRSVEPMAMKKTLCYTIGTFLLAKLLGGMIIMVTPGPKDWEDARCVGFLVFWYVGALVFWYLKSLAVWRFTLTPLYYVARNRHVPDLATFVAVYVGCYLLRHVGLPYWTHEWIFYGPYYALGLMLSPSRWSELLKDRRCLLAAVMFLVAWVASLALVPAMRDWNDVACTRGFVQCPNSHWPASMQFSRRAITASNFLDDLRVYSLQNGLSMSIGLLVAACARPLEALSPRLAAVLFGCGTRTLYGYVLHFMFFLLFGARMGVKFPKMESWQWATLCFPLAAQALFVYCSSLTERLFSWVIMPFWMLRVFGQHRPLPKV